MNQSSDTLHIICTQGELFFLAGRETRIGPATVCCSLIWRSNITCSFSSSQTSLNGSPETLVQSKCHSYWNIIPTLHWYPHFLHPQCRPSHPWHFQIWTREQERIDPIGRDHHGMYCRSGGIHIMNSFVQDSVRLISTYFSQGKYKLLTCSGLLGWLCQASGKYNPFSSIAARACSM